MKRPDAIAKKDKTKYVCPDPTFGGKYPTIAEYMCDTWWNDGKPREVSTLAISFDDNSVRIALNDKALQQTAYTNAATVEEALDLLEESLTSGRGVWRVWKVGKSK